MLCFLLGTGWIITSGFISLAFFSKQKFSGQKNLTMQSLVSTFGVVTGGALATWPTLQILRGTTPLLELSIPWHLPYASFALKLDALSSLFLVLLFILGGLCSISLLAHSTRKATTPFFFNLLVASIAITLTARNGILFLFAWEIMALSSFFLVIENDESPSVQRAGLLYLVVSHVGTALLATFFILLAVHSHSFDFNDWKNLASPLNPTFASVLFFLALLGFGSKAGFFPLHIWLPEAHPAAPSAVSALLSSVLIKMGVYGLLRFLPLLGQPQSAWGWTFIFIGAISGVGGVVFALAQKDLKKLLAFSSIENMGIILLGLGLGVLGTVIHSPLLAFLGLGGAVFHVINHALFKGLLFLGAGAVQHATATRDLDLGGGLMKKEPLLGFCFLVGSLAICGMPPLNGFLSELLIVLGAFRGSITFYKITFLPFICVLFCMALIGGLSLACFAKAFGAVFLGLPRDPPTPTAPPPLKLIEKLPLLILATLCFSVSIFSPWVLKTIYLTLLQTGFLQPDPLQPFKLTEFEAIPQLIPAFQFLTLLLIVFLVILLTLYFIRKCLPSPHAPHKHLTWDCGYAFPSVKMQYTGSSLVQPITQWFSMLLKPQMTKPKIQNFFPDQAQFTSQSDDIVLSRFYGPLFQVLDIVLNSLKRLQHGKMQFYLLYIFITLMVLLVWSLEWPL